MNKHPLIGRTITGVRMLRSGESEGHSDPYEVSVLELDDGSLVLGSQDEQLFGLGELFCMKPSESSWTLVIPPDTNRARRLERLRAEDAA